MSVCFDATKLLALVHRTRPIIMDSKKAHQITEKGLMDYVTQVDFSVQAFLEQELKQLHPDIQLLGEEQTHRTLDVSRPFWILDPIDGTTNLIHNYQQSCVALALYDEGALRFAVVYNPFHDETYHAIKDSGAFLNGSPIHVSNRPDLAHSLMLFGTTPYEKNRADSVFEAAKQVFLRAEDLRRGGSAELDLCAVACGRADGFFELNLKPWDFAAGRLILEEAGGQMTNYTGKFPFPGENSDIIATNGLIHRELSQLLSPR